MNTGPLSTRARLADLALAVYLAPLFQGRRVAVVGPASGEVARRARVLGAHTVVSFGGIGDDIAVRALVPGAIAGMHGKVDVIIVPDAGSVPSLVAVLDEARRALGSEGVVVVASEPDEGPVPLEAGAKRSVGFFDLEDLCLARFATVRMLGRGPFVGYTVASLDEGSDEVALDTRLIDGDPPRPEAFIAVASDSAVTVEALAVVQIPSEVLADVRASASKAFEDEVAKKDQKLKEVEAASAERWVKIQRYEHGLKELEEENRKSRDKAVRLSKELEDERKLRQRIELEAQMSRRAPELPKTPDLEPEVRRFRELAERLEKELAASRQAAETSANNARKELAEARAQTAAAVKRATELERELDETQSAEADLRTQLDEALERAEVVAHDPEVASLRQVNEALRAEVERAREGSHVDEEHARLERALAQHSAELAKVRAERGQMEQAVRELSLSLAEAHRRDHAEEASELRSRLSSMASVHAALVERAEALGHENAVLRERVAQAEAHAVAVAGEAQQARWRVGELEAAGSKTGHSDAARSDEFEAKAAQAAMELEGARADHARRVAELEREIERLVKALQVSATQVTFERDADVGTLRRELQMALAEREGLTFRVNEAERALLDVQGRTTPPVKTPLDDDDDAASLMSHTRMEQVLADLSATAERLARTEEDLARARQELEVTRNESDVPVMAPEDVVELRAELDTLVRRCDDLARDRDRRAVDIELLIAQLSDRDLRLAALEARREEELMGAQRLIMMEAQANRSLRTSLDSVRSGLSAILVDGRGAMVAHDLMTLLRRIEEAG